MENIAYDFIYYFQKLLDAHSFLVPLGIIGIWRWSVWLFKEIIALKYKPQKGNFKTSVSIVTPVYNENPKVFSRALYTWIENKPLEIIAVIDHTDKRNIEIFKRFSIFFKAAKLIVTKIPGKRPALALGIRKAKGEVVALVDSDTFWEKDVIKNGLIPFEDKKVGGVSTYQNVHYPKKLTQKIFDTHLDLRYSDEFPFLAASGDALICLSGRTAFYRRSAVLPLLDDLVNETFWGQPVISGDDKRLTYLVLENGWKLKFQNNSRVFTPGMKNFSSYLKQRLRWSRNSLRSDLKAIWGGLSFQYPALTFFQIDKVLQAFVILLSPTFFIFSIVFRQWEVSILIFSWWMVSRAIKIYPHLRRRPQDIIILPFFVPYQFLTSIVKMYALFTLNSQGWITRWHKERLKKTASFKLARAYVSTLAFFLILFVGVYFYKQETDFKPLERQRELIQKTLPMQRVTISSLKNQPKQDLLSKKYEIKVGDSMASIAQKHGIDLYDLLNANVSRLTNWNKLDRGTVLNIPGKNVKLKTALNFNYQRTYPDPLKITYDQPSDTIVVSGRGQNITLSDIQASVGKEYLEETSPKNWFLKANLFVRSGVTFNLNKNEAEWLKLKSDKNKFVTIRGFNGIILVDGVKITSWDESKNDYDKEIKDGRSYILVKDGSRMDFIDSELAYLGYARTPNLPYSSYGVSWRMSNGKLGTTLLTGDIINSKFHHNYFGAYTFGATGMTWRGNEFFENIKYGLDPHDDSNGFLVENNKFYNNGSHGLIFSKRCTNNIIRNNYSYNNKLHGIMLHEKSDNNLIENNVLYGNTDGIAILRSSNNVIKNNIIKENKRGIRANMDSNQNIIEANDILNNKQYGIYFHSNAKENLARNNNVSSNSTGFYVKSGNNQIVNNNVTKNKIGIYLFDSASGNKLVQNSLTFNSSYAIYSKTKNGSRNFEFGNDLYRNRRDILARLVEEPKKETKKISFLGIAF